MTYQPTDKPRTRFFYKPSAVVALGIISMLLIYVGYGWFMIKVAFPDGSTASVSATARGVFGDMYGTLNGFFSSAAMLAAIMAIVMQREELKLQREDLKLQSELAEQSRKESAEQSLMQIHSNEASRKVFIAQSLNAIFAMFENESMKPSYRIIDSFEFRNKESSLLSSEERDSAEHICRVYDTIGFMLKNDLIPTEYVIKLWGHRVLHVSEILFRHESILEIGKRYPGFKYLFDASTLHILHSQL